MRRRRLVGGNVLFAIVTLLSAGPACEPEPPNPVELAYTEPGAWEVSTDTAADAEGHTFTLYYPTDLGEGGLRHPVVSWGNGTGATPANYDGLLRHLASWGFVVVASDSGTTGVGTEITAGANHMIAADADPSSPFYQRLDTSNVAAAGHSQGAGGSTRAVIANPGLFTTLVAVALPDERWVGPGHEFDTADVTRPAFFIGGSSDVVIAGPETLTGYYDRVPGAAAVALLIDAGHNTIQQDGNGLIGYLTAWLAYQLQGDEAARAAFAGDAPELLSNDAWQNQATKDLT